MRRQLRGVATRTFRWGVSVAVGREGGRGREGEREGEREGGMDGGRERQI